MSRTTAESHTRRVVVAFAATLGMLAIVFAPNPVGLSPRGQATLAVMFFAGVLWVARALPLAVTALTIPLLLATFGVYGRVDPALSGFSDPLIFLFIAGFMLANALQKYNIDRRIALWVLSLMGSSPRRLILAIMLATAFLSMWVSNTATTAMMMPIALGILAEVLGREQLVEEGGTFFSNMQIATLLGTAYAASVGGVGTLIGTPPNVVVVAFLNRLLGYELTFADWLFVGVPVVVVTLPIVWYVLTYWLFPPELTDVEDARAKAAAYLSEEGSLDTMGRRVAYIFAATAVLWILGGFGFLFEGLFPPEVFTTLFGGTGTSIFGTAGHAGILYFVLVGLFAIPALSLSGAMDWDDLVDIDWGTILLFGGGISLADALADTGATEWVSQTVFGSLVGAPIVLVVGAVVLFVVLLTEMTSNTATTTIITPILIGIGGIFAATLGIEAAAAAVFLAVSGAIAASFAFALPVATPPNAIVFGGGYMEQRHMLRAGMVLNALMTVVLTALLVALFYFVWPMTLW
ncbi:SLC13 family permease [Haloferax namakaokahaiae]|uniref:SLC13 family permease n=1 Tax=Haloferax namakaokahaiae TaxID=1748331 RepID=A0ABD5Z9G3_9EURY